MMIMRLQSSTSLTAPQPHSKRGPRFSSHRNGGLCKAKLTTTPVTNSSMPWAQVVRLDGCSRDGESQSTCLSSPPNPRGESPIVLQHPRVEDVEVVLLQSFQVCLCRYPHHPYQPPRPTLALLTRPTAARKSGITLRGTTFPPDSFRSRRAVINSSIPLVPTS